MSVSVNNTRNTTAIVMLAMTMSMKPNTNINNEDEDRELFEVVREITGLYLLPFICVFGIFGNVCNMLVYSHSKKSSTNVYLVALAISDIIKLLNDFIYFLVNLVGKLDPVLSQHLFSSLYLYSHYIFVLTAINTAWLTCTIAIDRYVIVSSKNQVKTSEMNYLKSILISMAILFVSCLIAVPSPLFLKPVDAIDPQTNLTVSKLADSEIVRENTKRIYNYFNVAIRAIIPLSLLIYLNFRIINILYRNKMRRRSSSITTSKAKAKSKITKMLLVIIFTFLLCVFPDAILTMMHLGYANENYLIRAIREVTDLLLDVNSASTCIICYYFSGQYRAKLKEIFGFKDKNIYERDDDTQYATAGVERMRLASQAFLNLNNK